MLIIHKHSNQLKRPAGNRQKANRSFLFIGIIMLATIFPLSRHVVRASDCPDLKVIFVRGSGAERYNNQDYQEFKASLETKLQTSDLSYEFEDLDYPAIGVTGDNITVAVGAFVSGGESYAFGDSVKQGVSKLTATVNGATCSNTKYVIGGYSQGAMVVSGSLEKLNPNRVIYAATFGDPKIFLPEGAGPLPAACKGSNLSDYRVYVPDCFAYKGLLGAREPYSPAGFTGKLGTWCNKYDLFCSSKYSISSHTAYVEDRLYEDASKLIFSKVAAEFGFKNDYTSPHDTAILIDSTGSMRNLITRYKAEALNLAKKTLSSGGRVALFDYRDLADGYVPVEKCSFKTCNLETFGQGLDSIQTGGGGDMPESLLSSSFQVMKRLDWRLGSTKSLVILTDAGYHSPDLDGTTFYDVQALSKQIDPVNFYIITTEANIDEYQSLALATDGKVASTADDLGILTDNIMERFDSLPRVEEAEENLDPTPLLTVNQAEWLSSSEYKVYLTTDADRIIVILNDAILGITDQHDITISDLNPAADNTLTLVPIQSDFRGEPVSISLGSSTTIKDARTNIPQDQPSTRPSVEQLTTKQSAEEKLKFAIPKAPNTGKK